MNRGQVAAKVRKSKEEHPERYCRDAKCLFRLKPEHNLGWCPKHQPRGFYDGPDDHDDYNELAAPSRCS